MKGRERSEDVDTQLKELFDAVGELSHLAERVKIKVELLSNNLGVVVKDEQPVVTSDETV